MHDGGKIRFRRHLTHGRGADKEFYHQPNTLSLTFRNIKG